MGSHCALDSFIAGPPRSPNRFRWGSGKFEATCVEVGSRVSRSSWLSRFTAFLQLSQVNGEVIGETALAFLASFPL